MNRRHALYPKPLDPPPEFEVPAEQVKVDAARKHFVACPGCNTPSYLGIWGVAHLCACDLFTTCDGCGARLTVLRQELQHD